MMQTPTKLFSDLLYLPDQALVYEMSRLVAQIYPDKFLLETEDYEFELDEYAIVGKCSLRLLDDLHPQFQTEWISLEKGGKSGPRNGMYEVRWRGVVMKVLHVTYGGADTERYYILADHAKDARAFFAAVCAWGTEVHGEILVYRGGYWRKDKDLHAQIQSASLDALVLPGTLKADLVADFEGFFAAREQYVRYGVAWKRGILLLGPPGNGKTHAVKALVNRLGRPCLYVRSFKSERGTIHTNIGHVFKKARDASPCLLVLEDLDTLVDKDNLSFFLNEMDGFAANEGILTVATTNHPEKLDSALLDRPSRFDRKITFALPGLPERHRFLALANERVDGEMRLSETDLDEVALATDGFSFAYLKELCLSATMSWMRSRQPGSMGREMLDQVETLRYQMKTEPPKVVPEEEED
jgi:hypothetical protein